MPASILWVALAILLVTGWVDSIVHRLGMQRLTAIGWLALFFIPYALPWPLGNDDRLGAAVLMVMVCGSLLLVKSRRPLRAAFSCIGSGLAAVGIFAALPEGGKVLLIAPSIVVGVAAGAVSFLVGRSAALTAGLALVGLPLGALFWGAGSWVGAGFADPVHWLPFNWLPDATAVALCVGLALNRWVERR